MLGVLTLVALAAALATGFLTLPFGLMTGGLLMWLLQGGPDRPPTTLVTWLVGLGLAGLAVFIVAAVVA